MPAQPVGDEVVAGSGLVFSWLGDTVVKGKTRRAVSRALVSTAEAVAALMKRKAHRLSGTLSRSVHSAPFGYRGRSDYAAARLASLTTGGSEGPNFTVWQGEQGEVWVGSWIPYALFEARRGGAHDFITGPGVQGSQSFFRRLEQALKEEGL